MSVFRFLDRLESAIQKSPKIPLTTRSIIDRDRILSLIDKFRASLPEELKKAQWISRESQRIIQESKIKADKIIKDAGGIAKETVRDAENECRKMASSHEIAVRAREEARISKEESEKAAAEVMQHAHDESDKILLEAHEFAEKLKRETVEESEQTRKLTDDYVNKVMGKLERDVMAIMKILEDFKSQQ